MSFPVHKISGAIVPWELISLYYTRVKDFHQTIPFENKSWVADQLLGNLGFIEIELPNPDVYKAERIIMLPVINKSDFVSIFRAMEDLNSLSDEFHELILLNELRKNIFGKFKPGIHIAVYEKGTWDSFFEKVAANKSKEFKWEEPLILYQPSKLQAFPKIFNSFSN